MDAWGGGLTAPTGEGDFFKFELTGWAGWSIFLFRGLKGIMNFDPGRPKIACDRI